MTDMERIDEIFAALNRDAEAALRQYGPLVEEDRDVAGAVSDHYWQFVTLNSEWLESEEARELGPKIYDVTQQAVRLDPHDYSYRMGRIYEYGIGLPHPEFRLARKYYEDAYEFGYWEAAEALSQMFAAELDRLGPDDPHRDYCEKSVASWHRLAEKSRLRAIAAEADPSRN